MNGLDLPGLEVHIYRVPQRAGKLTHKAAGLAEIFIFRLLGRPCQDYGLHPAAIEKLADYPAHKHGKGR